MWLVAGRWRCLSMGMEIVFFFVSYVVVSFILCKFAFVYCKIVLLWLSLKPM